MAHFVELDSNNVVLRGIVVANADTASADGTEKEYIGQAFCERLLGGTWKQTSYNGNFRKNYAGIGYTFDGIGFAAPQPYPSWTLDLGTYLWNAPTPMPVEEGKMYEWDEATLSWVEVEIPA